MILCALAGEVWWRMVLCLEVAIIDSALEEQGRLDFGVDGALLSIFLVGLGTTTGLIHVGRQSWMKGAIEVFYAPRVWVRDRSD